MTANRAFVECPSTFFLGLNGIKIPAITIPGLKIGDDLKLLHDGRATARMVGSYAEQIGSLEYNYLTNKAPAIIYCNHVVSVGKSNISEWVNGLIIQRLSRVQNFLMKLWLIKDNAVDPDTGWMAIQHNGEPIINSNRWSSSYCKADGSTSETTFSKEELSQVADVPLDPEDVADGKAVPLGRAGSSEERITKLSHESLRVQRFLYFVNGARTTRDVAIKLALYCSGLEALVSTSHSELTHQVAERVAVLLHSSGGARLETFRLVKAAYGLRSRAVHGATFKDKDQRQLIEASIKLDQVCREVTFAYLQSDDFQEALEFNSDQFSDFWMKRLFL
jgi:hypothetical protein